MMRLKIDVPEGYEIDKDNSTFELIKFKKKVDTEGFEHFRFMGSFVDDKSKIIANKHANSILILGDKNHRRVWINEELAQASLAMAELSVRMASPTYNGDWKPNWGDNRGKWVIKYYGDELEINNLIDERCFIVFKSEEIAKKFLKHNKELIEEAKPLL